MLSYWEQDEFVKYDLIIVGGGLIGTQVAIEILKNYPEKKLLILERGVIPAGASTKNIGLICLTEFCEAAENFSPEIIADVKRRYEGIQHYFENFDPKSIELEQIGQCELLMDYQLKSLEKLEYINHKLYPIFNDNLFELRNDMIEEQGFNKDKIKACVHDKFSARMHSGKLMKELIKKVFTLGGNYISGAEVLEYKKNDLTKEITVLVQNTVKELKNFEFKCQDLMFCTNAFTTKFLPNCKVAPGRGQVFVTKPIKNLKIRGSFTAMDDFYYFRDYNGERLIFGGGKRLDFNQGQTFEIKNSQNVMDHLVKRVQDTFMPGVEFEIDRWWSGIMGFCPQNKDYEPILDKYSDNVYVAAKFCGNGLSIAPFIAKNACQLIYGQKKQLITAKL